MIVFADTSGLFAVLDAGDLNHRTGRRIWEELMATAEASRARVVTSNYVLVELCALAQRRLGVDALRAIEEDLVPALQVQWVTEAQHRTAMMALLTAGRRRLSLVDCVSFGVMRDCEAEFAFAFDAHFREQGFRCLE